MTCQIHDVYPYRPACIEDEADQLKKKCEHILISDCCTDCKCMCVCAKLMKSFATSSTLQNKYQI